MTDSTILLLLLASLGGVIAGIVLTLAFNKLKSGRASAGAVKREFEDYQQQVEAHFDETSEKFKAIAEQYKDLYQHLAVGATSLCRPEHVVAGLTDQSDPLAQPQARLGQAESNRPKAQHERDQDEPKKASESPPADNNPQVTSKPAVPKAGERSKPVSDKPTGKKDTETPGEKKEAAKDSEATNMNTADGKKSIRTDDKSA